MQETFTKGKKVACPRSWDNAGLLTDFEIHYCKPAELKAFGGVCRKCRKQIEKHGAAILSGKIESPGPMAPPPAQMPDGAAWQSDRHDDGQKWAELTPTTEFDFAAVCEPDRELDEALGLVADASPDARREAAELFSHVARWCFGGQRGNLKAATAKFAVVIAGLHPEILDGQTFEQIGQRLNLTKAAISKCAVKFQAAFNIRLSRCRSKESRAHMAAAQLGHAPTNYKRAGRGAGRPPGGGLKIFFDL